MFKIDNAAVRPAARLILAQAFQAARTYDGQEAAYERLEASLIAFEKLVAAQGSGLARDKAEAAVSAALRRTHRGVTVQDLLDLAIRRFARRLEQDRVPIMVVETGFSFLPTQGEKPVKTGSGAGFTMPPTLERTRALIAALIENGIYVDDLIAYSGIAPPGHLRQQAYTLIQIPRCEREILVCDEFGQASFVGKELRGPLFWATNRKDKLDAVPDIARVINREGALDQILSLILTDNPPRAKVKIARPYGFPLSEDIILRHALLYAASHEGKLPTEDSGEVEGLPGQTWYAWTMALRQRGNGLTREGIKGLAHLFRLYGLKLRRKENPEVIKAALVNLAKTGKHGLVVQEEFHLTEDLILYHALVYAASNDYNLPTQRTGEVKGLPGQNWINWDMSLRRCMNGLTREGVTGLPHLFNLYGLKDGRNEIPEAIAAALEILHASDNRAENFSLADTLARRAGLPILAQAVA